MKRFTLLLVVLLLFVSQLAHGATRKEFPGGWYADALPNGQCVAVIQGQHVATCDGRAIAFATTDPLFIRMSIDGRFAGMGWGDGIAWEFQPGVGWVNNGAAFGNRSVIYTADNRLVVVRGPGTWTGSIGWRYAADDGVNLIASWETYDPTTSMSRARGVTDLWEWTERGDVICGQGGQGIQCLLGANKRRVQVEGGDTQFVNVNRWGDSFSFATAKLAQRESVVIFMTRAELEALPTVKPPPVDPPVPPVDPPVPPIDPPVQNPTLPDAIYNELVATRPKYPTPMGDKAAALLNEVAFKFPGWGLEAKPGGNNCPQPVTGTRTSCDIMRGPGNFGYDVLGDSEGAAIPVRATGGAANPGTFVAAVPSGSLPPIDPPTPPADDILAILQQINARLGAIEARLGSMEVQNAETRAALAKGYAELKADLEYLKVRPIPFPDYVGRVLGQTITLRPVPQSR